MNTFYKILAGVLVFFVLLLIGLNLYFTEERLQSMIMPKIQELTGSDVQAERMSLTFFRTFPRFGVEVGNLVVPDPDGETVASAEELLVSVELFPLFRNEVSISRLSLHSPVINYTVFADSSTNIDFLLETADEDPEELGNDEGYAITIPRFAIRSAEINVLDQTTPDSAFSAQVRDFDADLSLRFAELIESTVDARIGSLSVSIGDANYLDNLAVSLNQTSTIDLDNELMTITEGTFSIRGLALNLAGTISSWGEESPVLDLQFTSTSDNFGELLGLAPPQYDEMLEGLRTRGSLVLEGSLAGQFTEETLPRFDLIVEVTDGFLQNPDLPDAIEDINFHLAINNDLATFRDFRAKAGDNTLSASGTIERPLDEDAVFSVDLDGDIDLATISRFYPIDEAGIEELRGLLAAKATATGRIDRPEEALFSGHFTLSDGLLKYLDVPRPIEQINMKVEADQDRMLIEESGFTAASNRLQLSGTILRPLDEEQRSVDVSAILNFDLATIKEFYPIDEDTLTMRGLLSAQVDLRGRPDPGQIETLVQRGTVELRNGYLAHEIAAQPLEDITFVAEASGPTLSISQAHFKTGENRLDVHGSISNYLSDEPVFDLTFDGHGLLSDLTAYYSLEPWIQELTGDATLNLNARGPAGDPLQIALNGTLEVNGVNAVGDSIPQPVTDLQGRLSMTPNVMTLETFSMNYGSSDIGLEGLVQRFLGFLEDHASEATMPSISGRYHSRFLHLDEMIDWDEEAGDDEPVPINLPHLTSSVDAQIDRMELFGLSITDITGRGRTTPDRILLEDARADLFEGTATGTMEWNVPDSLNTNIHFSGSLDSLSAQAFFRDTGFFGKSNLHQYLSGTFSADIDYESDLDASLSPDLSTTRAEGHFGMSRARLRDHPIQKRLAEWLRTSELENLALDEWTATFSVEDEVMTFEDLRLTSDNIGIQLAGTQHLVTDQIDYRATVLLPESFKGAIASVISNRAADGLQREDGMMTVPVRITGTSASPRVGPDTDVIDNILQELIQDTGRDVLRRLFDRN